MTLASGSKLGQYEIVGPLDAGGMGEVYRARDSQPGHEARSVVVNRPTRAAAAALVGPERKPPLFIRVGFGCRTRIFRQRLVESLKNVLWLSIACRVNGGNQGTVFGSRRTTKSFGCEREIWAAQLPATAALSTPRAIDWVEVGPHGRINAALARIGISRV
jgi:hypothetical protein